MRSSKLYSILGSFSKIEQNRFRKYLQSPYFNRSETITELFNILADDINGEGKVDLKKEVVWQQLELSVPYDDTRFRKYLSDLLKLLESFLAQQAYEKDPLYQASFLIEAIGNRDLEKLYNSSMRSAQRMVQHYPHESSNFYFHQYKIERNYYNLIDAEIKRGDKNNVEEINKYLDLFYISEKLKFYLPTLSQKRVAKYEYKIELIEQLLQYLETKDFTQNPRIALYHKACYLYLDPENEKHYYELRTLLQKYAMYVPPQEANDDLYVSAENYCVKKLNEGNSQFLAELFSLYKEKVERDIVIDNEEISPWVFRNIVTVALRLGEYEWIEDFIFQYKEKLTENYRENAFTFSLAQLYFYRKEFDKVIELLREVEYEDFTYNLNSKVMLLFTYYEMDEIEPLYSLFESFRVYLNRHKAIPEQRKNNYKNLIKYTKKLTKVMPGDKKAIEKLKKEVQETPKIASKGWLKQKIAELEGV
jgi:hypothetical protein